MSRLIDVINEMQDEKPSYTLYVWNQDSVLIMCGDPYDIYRVASSSLLDYDVKAKRVDDYTGCYDVEVKL